MNNEVFSGTLHSPRTFELDGWTNADANRNLDKHVNARMGIVQFAGKKRYTFAAGADFRMNPKYWDVGGGAQAKPGSTPGRRSTTSTCTPRRRDRMPGGHEPDHAPGGSRSALAQDDGVADTDWIPGDCGLHR